MAEPTSFLPAHIAARVTVQDDGCWVWTRATNQGYGVAWHQNRVWRTHRLAWIGAGNKLVKGLVLDHLCRNRACCNPAHLRQVTYRDNLLAEGSLSNAAIRAAKTHCIRGHELAGDNVRLYRGKRNCKACETIREANRTR